MKPLIVSTFDTHGGAARAALRLHKGLQRQGLPSQMLVQYQFSDDPTIRSTSSQFERWIDKLKPTLDDLPLKLYQQRVFQDGIFSLHWVPDQLSAKINLPDIDVVNLHWIRGYMQLESLSAIKKPLVWTLHDMWAFTGGCHYAVNCEHYQHHCGHCPQLGSQQDWDLSSWVWHRKSKAWQNLKLTLVTPSQWLARCVKSSALLQHQSVVVIPNSLDTQIFKPVAPAIARDRLNLPQNKPLLLFGTASPNANSRKGIHLLQAALQKLKSAGKSDLELVIFGASQPQSATEWTFKTHFLGSLGDEVSLALAYAAADIFIAPSTQDNLPNTVMEALACGTPCLAFKIGGMPDMILHQQNGYLAQPFEPEDLVQGITWLLEDSNRLQQLKQQARETAEQEFTLSVQAQRYAQLFEQVIEQHPADLC